jgi:hypothetical protein
MVSSDAYLHVSLTLGAAEMLPEKFATGGRGFVSLVYLGWGLIVIVYKSGSATSNRACLSNASWTAEGAAR